MRFFFFFFGDLATVIFLRKKVRRETLPIQEAEHSADTSSQPAHAIDYAL